MAIDCAGRAAADNDDVEPIWVITRSGRRCADGRGPLISHAVDVAFVLDISGLAAARVFDDESEMHPVIDHVLLRPVLRHPVLGNAVRRPARRVSGAGPATSPQAFLTAFLSPQSLKSACQGMAIRAVKVPGSSFVLMRNGRCRS